MQEAADKVRVACAWIVQRDQPDYPDAMVARLATDRVTVYLMVAASLVGFPNEP